MIGQSSLLKIVRGIEPNEASVADYAQNCGFPVDRDFAAALDDPQVTAVILATPHALHDEQIARAAAAGKHVFCEKPLSLTRAGAQTSVRLMREKNLVLGIGHERRWEPPIAKMLIDAKSGKFGTLLQFEANFSHDKFVTLDADNWRLSSANAPAGGMTATGIHLFDLATTLFGDGEAAFASSATLASGIANGDSTCAMVRYVGGRTAYVSTMLATPFISRLALFGSEGWIEIQDKAHVEAPEGWRVTSCEKGKKPQTIEVPPNNAVLENLEAFARAILKRAPYPITPDDMIANTAVLEAIFKSARNGKTQLVN